MVAQVVPNADHVVGAHLLGQELPAPLDRVVAGGKDLVVDRRPGQSGDKPGHLLAAIFIPALLVAAGLSLALSSPNVRYGDLAGHLDLIDDPTVPGFLLEEGYLVATDAPGLGCTVEM